MFGYVTPLKPELKVREYNEFKGYYCGVCFSIKSNFGNLPRALLNYDMTFLALLLDSLSRERADASPKRCIAHPTNKKAVIINNKAIDYAANMNISLAYFKALDDIQDDKSLKSNAKALIMSPYKRKFSPCIKEINHIIDANLKDLSQLEESKKFTSIDEICHPFSIIVGKILELYPFEIFNDSKEKRDLLYYFGYTLGKWIYLVDAIDDLEEDMKKDKFNPINFLYNNKNLSHNDLLSSSKETLEFSILNCAYNCKSILDNLEVQKNIDILNNIISLGMMDKYTKVINKCNLNNKKGSAFNESI